MTTILKAFSKEELITKLKDIYAKGWIKNYRGHNDGAVGNILEDLLGIPENNLPIPNASEWELKAQRANTSSLVTMFHSEPSPTAMSLVPNFLLPKYGWPHKQAGKRYPNSEKSFRATLNATGFSDRGLAVVVNDAEQRVEIQFNSHLVDERHHQWKKSILEHAGHLENFEITPYWGFDDLFHKAGTKLLNCFYVRAEVMHQREKGKQAEYFLYNHVQKLSKFNQLKFIQAIREGKIYIDFDARTGHNHGTKFRIRHTDIPYLYEHTEVILDMRNEQ